MLLLRKKIFFYRFIFINSSNLNSQLCKTCYNGCFFGSMMDMNIFKLLFGGEKKIAAKSSVNSPLSQVTLTSNHETDQLFCYHLEKILSFSGNYSYSQVTNMILLRMVDIKRLYEIYLKKCMHLEDAQKYQSEDYCRKKILEAANLVIMLYELRAPLEIMPQLENDSELGEAMQIVGLAHQMRNSSILCFEWAMVAYLYEAGRWNHRIGVKRARSLFLELMKPYFEKSWPKGFEIGKHEYVLQNNIYYCGENYSIRGILNRYFKHNNLPDPETYNWRHLTYIANQVEDKIASYARALGRNVSPLRAMLLLPPEIIVEQIKNIDSSIITWLDDIVTSVGSIKRVDLIEHLFGMKQKKESMRELIDVIIFLAYLGYGVEPDPKFNKVRRPKLDDVCIIFNSRDLGDPRQAVSDMYALAKTCVILIVGMQANSDEISIEKQNKWVENIRGSFELSEYESRRLNAYFKWLYGRKITASQIKNALAAIPQNTSDMIASFVTSIACDMGSIEKNKISFLEKVYDELKINRNNLYGKLHANAARSAIPAIEPILIRKSKIDTIKKNNSESSPIALKMKDDNQKIAIDSRIVREISIETDKVSSMLKNIFKDSASDDAETENYSIKEDKTSKSSSPFSGLDFKHENFIKNLFLKKTWCHEEVETLARELGLMPYGALEVINDWAFECFGESFAEDGDKIEINDILAAQLKNS